VSPTVRFLRRHEQPPRSTAGSPEQALEPHVSGVGPSWLAWQTLTYSGAAQIKAAGVMHHATEVRAAAAQYGWLVMAELRIEQAGKYAGAVRVYVAGVELGSVPHGHADDFRGVIERLAAAGQPATCRANLDVSSGEYLDLWLCAKARERAGDDPFLPPMLGARLTLAPDTITYLNQKVLGLRAKSKRVVRTASLAPRNERWIVLFDDRELGDLPAGRYPRLEQALGAGFPVTCQIRVLRQPDRPVRVDVDVPNEHWER
jgi:hypothetical protein